MTTTKLSLPVNILFFVPVWLRPFGGNPQFWWIRSRGLREPNGMDAADGCYVEGQLGGLRS